MPSPFALHSGELMAVVAAIILSASRDPNSETSITTAAETANKLIQKVGRKG